MRMHGCTSPELSIYGLGFRVGFTGARLHSASADASDGVLLCVVGRAIEDVGDVDAGKAAVVSCAEHAEVRVHLQQPALKEVLQGQPFYG